MEYQVRTVAGIESCYVSLPLSLIQRLDSSARPNFSSQILCLHLQSSSTPSLYWHVAWSGSASTSPSVIEVSQQFADCIGLPDRSLVVVRALPNVPKASFVTIEPLTEDDWEVLELNSEAAESAILSQVRIVSESMRFPLWLHGHAVVTFVVISTVPKHAVVQLVPGAEIAVAPKRRQKSGNYSKESKMQSLDGSHPFEPVLLRVQDPKKMLLHNSNIGDVDVRIEISTIALIHPDTGKSCMIDPLRVVVLIPRVQLKAKLNENENEGIRKKVSSSLKDANGQTSTRDTESRYAVVQILFSETVAKGHLMLSLPLRRIYVQRYVNHLKELPIFSCAPCQFITEKKNRDSKSNDVEAFENDSLSKSMIRQSSEENIGMLNWSVYQKHVSSIPFEVASKEGEDVTYCSDPRKGIHGLLLTWSKAQCHAIRSISGVEPSSLILGPINFLHFAFGDPGVDGKLQKLAINSTQRKRGAREPSKEILCSLRSTSEQLNYDNFVAYELSIGPNTKGDLTSVTEKLVIENAASFESVKEEVFNHQFSSTSSDLNWLSGPASDATNSRANKVAVSWLWFGVHYQHSTSRTHPDLRPFCEFISIT
ncbi:hypothetical protein V2J09_021438 [Rumex salicifolius]